MLSTVHGLSESAVIPLEVQHQVPIDWLVLRTVHGFLESAVIPLEVQQQVPVDWLVPGTMHGSQNLLQFLLKCNTKFL